MKAYRRILLPVVLIFLVMLSGSGISQTESGVLKYSTRFLSRYRLSFGLVNLLPQNNAQEFRHYFFNLSYRSSGFKEDSVVFSVKFAFEPGINGLIVSNGFKNRYELYFIPYAKFGPELRLTRNLFLAGSVGLVLITYGNGVFFTPFYGANGFYMFDINENLSLELETGFHSTFYTGSYSMLGYFTIGISLR